jgi:hypothetical protein
MKNCHALFIANAAPMGVNWTPSVLYEKCAWRFAPG